MKDIIAIWSLIGLFSIMNMTGIEHMGHYKSEFVYWFTYKVIVIAKQYKCFW